MDSFCYHNGMSFTLRVGCEFNPPPRSSLLLLLSLHLGHRIQLKIPLADAHTLKWEFPTLKPIRNQFQLSKKKSNKAVEICYRNIKQSKTITECLSHQRSRIWPKVQESIEDLLQELLRMEQQTSKRFRCWTLGSDPRVSSFTLLLKEFVLVVAGGLIKKTSS